MSKNAMNYLEMGVEMFETVQMLRASAHRTDKVRVSEARHRLQPVSVGKQYKFCIPHSPFLIWETLA